MDYTEVFEVARLVSLVEKLAGSIQGHNQIVVKLQQALSLLQDAKSSIEGSVLLTPEQQAELREYMEALDYNYSLNIKVRTKNRFENSKVVAERKKRGLRKLKDFGEFEGVL